MAVCLALGVARSNVHLRQARGPAWRDGRRGRVQATDAQLLAELCEHIAALPSYGYRRAGALLSRQRLASGLPRVNHKRVYRLMANNGLLLPKAPRRRQSSRLHMGKVGVNASDQRWCSDGFEIKCDRPDRNRNLCQGLLRPRNHGLACLGGQGPAGRASARNAYRIC